ncbi:nuclear envelope integral membrane protein 2-like isoform X1 [Chiloscyllium plagiosum]|uniref:nuclear envelope integral membrane protein 2-like isoform X1 n=2 Tax=Chiloscyllium plagiosum TaxID=36176 RepID=UPI001CB83AC8|nr:nuclear envelope integral membrane protein 2-like isoform X1 [Chiloscyllium plagiosum]
MRFLAGGEKTKVKGLCEREVRRRKRSATVADISGNSERGVGMWQWQLGSALATWLYPAVALVIGTAALPREMIYDDEVYYKNEKKLFCYAFSQKLNFVDYWSTVEVNIKSSELMELTYPAEESSFHEPETLKDFIKYFYYQVVSSSYSSATEFIINIERCNSKTCFKVEPKVLHARYTITVKRQQFELKLISLFVAGIILFVYAKSISRNELFHYCVGFILGIFAPLVLLLLVCKRIIQRSTFLLLMIASFSTSAFLIYSCVINQSQYRKYLYGYLFVVSCLSYVIFKRHKPLSDEHSITLLSWTLQLVATVLIYCGVTFSQCAYAVIVILLCGSNLHHPINLIRYIYRKMKQLFKKQEVRFFTEEEYKEQSEVATIKALEDLRRYCKNQDFPTWEVISKVSSPKRLADFILGACHITPEEMQNHEQHYGIGGSFLEAQLFVKEENNHPVSENGEMAAADGNEAAVIMN